jgi:hypothetical protein
MILDFKNTYQKLSSNGLDFAELKPKPVENRQTPIDPFRRIATVVPVTDDSRKAKLREVKYLFRYTDYRFLYSKLAP